MFQKKLNPALHLALPCTAALLDPVASWLQSAMLQALRAQTPHDLKQGRLGASAMEAHVAVRIKAEKGMGTGIWSSDGLPSPSSFKSFKLLKYVEVVFPLCVKR